MHYNADSTTARIQQLETALVAVCARLDRLEARFAPGDHADVAALVAIGTTLGACWFTSAQLRTYARTDPALLAALEAADVTNAFEIGKLLARLRLRTIDGFAVERDDPTRRWRIVART